MRYNEFKTVIIAVACLSVLSFAALPEMRITSNGEPNVVTKCNGQPQQVGGWCMGTTTTEKPYINITNFQLTSHSARNSKPDSIKVRGNSTANATKKPYKIKFSEKVSLFSKEAAKSWVLLANFYDATFALNAMAFELGKRLGLEFTPTSQLVDLYINNQYKGIYQLTEQIQSNKGRVDIREKHKGWLVEFDYHDPEQDERLSYFKTSKYSMGTFIKAPELDEMDNPNDSTQLRFVKTDINNLFNKMEEGGFPNNGYRDLIDLESFAKYVLIQLVMDNSDFNSKFQNGALPGSNYAYKIDSNKTSKIKAGPLWDFDLAVVTKTSHPRHDYNNYRETIFPTHAFYKRLWEDDVFKAKYRKIWTKHKKDFEAMTALIDSIKNVAEGSVNNNQWNSGTLNTQTFNSEITSLKNWWNNRLGYVEQQLASIDTTKDIISPIIHQQIAGDNRILIIKNSVNLQVKKFAHFEIYNLNGRLEKSMNFTSGIYNVPLGDLPKGMYVAKVSFGDGVKVLRVPVM